MGCLMFHGRIHGPNFDAEKIERVSKMPPRELHFKDFSEGLREVDRLVNGYSSKGEWDLAQVCDHLAYFIEGSLDGHQYKVPWLLKVLFGGLVRKRILRTGKMKANVPTPQKPLPARGMDQAQAIARIKKAIARLESHRGEMHDSPFFGHLTPDEWRRLHLTHMEHHLGYLIPK